MVREFINTLVEEYNEAESMKELNLLTATNTKRGVMNDVLKAAHAAAETRINGGATAPPSTEGMDALDMLLASFQGPAIPVITPVVPRPTAPPVVKATVTTTNVAPARRTIKKYKLLKIDLEWTNKPQVHAIMAILNAHIDIGDTIAEDEIVKMMIANEAVLNTTQGGKRIWDYYKGTHNDGLTAHGNVEVVA